MKKLSLLVLLIGAFAGITKAQKSCCHIALASNGMAVFADNEDFRKAHLEPIPYVHSNALGNKISFPGADGKTAWAYEIKAKTKSDKYLIVIQEWWGLNDYIMKEADQLYTDLGSNVNVIAVDLYDGKVATSRDSAGKYMKELTPERGAAIIQGAIKYAGSKAKIASIGWCMGGGWSLQTALLAGKQDVGCIMYYGSPVQDVDKLKTLNTDVLGIFAKQDKWITTAQVDEFEKNMKAAGKKVEVHSFDADHAFANPSNPGYDKTATAEAYKLSLAYLKSHLK